MKKVFLIIAAVILIAGCSENPKDSGSGRLSIKVTDDPFDISYVESATVTITKIEVRRAGLDTTDGNPFIVVWAVSYTHLRAHETDSYLVCRLLLEKKKK